MGAQGVSALPLLVVEHPLGGERPEAIARRAQQAFEQLNSLIAGSSSGTVDPKESTSGATTLSNRPPTDEAGLRDPAPINIADDPIAVLEAFTQRNLADGLPIIAPTEERVTAMLGGRDGGKSLGMMPPLWRQVTLEKLAVNAVMAGRQPRAVPLVVAAGGGRLERAGHPPRLGGAP